MAQSWHEIKKKLSRQELGFSDGNYPDKTWAVNVVKKNRTKSFFISKPQRAGLIKSHTKEQVEIFKQNAAKKNQVRKQLIQEKKLLKLSKLIEKLEIVNQGTQEEVEQRQQCQRRN